MRGAEDAEAALLEGIDDAERKREFRANNGEGGFFGFGEADHGGQISEVNGYAAGDLRHAAVAGRTDDFGDARAARHCPRQRVLASAGTKDEDLH